MARPGFHAAAGGELALIERIRRRAGNGRGPVRLGIGDDCAILRVPRGQELLVTTDFSLEGRHFLRQRHPARSIGHRALARGLSDLAAMGAKPLAAFLSLALPTAVARDRRWVNGFLDGLLALAQRCGVPLAGGDTSESPSDHVLADIVLLGTAPQGRALKRDGARPGDVLYVTGALGGAAAELGSVLRGPALRGPVSRSGTAAAALSARHPHLYPQPRLAVGQALVRRRLARAAIDLSDGLSTDLLHLCEASSVAALVEAGALPIHAVARRLLPTTEARMQAALHGGEDYELLFAAPAEARLPQTLAGVPITPIGRVVRFSGRGPRVTLVDAAGHRAALEAQGWEHLR